MADFLEEVEVFAARMLAEFPKKRAVTPVCPLMWSPERKAHAEGVLKLSPTLAAARYTLCPKRITEDHFWSSYFTVLRYHLHPSLHLPITDLSLDDDDTDATEGFEHWTEPADWTCKACLTHQDDQFDECQVCTIPRR
eukprot:TRINITY_DN45386_c0_g1_i1.p1 TRINITY_DN45386_c0_g1~~TRINITY_DN45386_c0_g1_i1.p1  ORF type:complete len:153 (+),score=34.29 TRINITY_DN45386_c0_g1_i1:47-460(+)